MNKTVEITKRPYDNMYNVFHLIQDPNYDILVSDTSNYVPKRWILKGVCSDEQSAKALEKSLLSQNT